MFCQSKVGRLALLWATVITYFVELGLFIYVTVGYFERGYETLGWLTAGILIVLAVVTVFTSILLFVADLMDKGTMVTPVWLYVVRIVLSLLLLDLVFRVIEYTYKTLKAIRDEDHYTYLIKQVRILLIIETFLGSIPQTTVELTAWMVLEDGFLDIVRSVKLAVSLVSMAFGMVTLFYLLTTSKENYSMESSQLIEFHDPEQSMKSVDSGESGQAQTRSRCWTMMRLTGWYALLLARLGAVALLVSTLLDYRYAVIFVAVYNVTIRVVVMELWNCGKCQQDYKVRLINAVMVFCYVDVMLSEYRKLRMVTYYLLSFFEIIVMASIGFSRFNDPNTGQVALFVMTLLLVVYCVILFCFHYFFGASNTVSVQPRRIVRQQEPITEEALTDKEANQTRSQKNGTTVRAHNTSTKRKAPTKKPESKKEGKESKSPKINRRESKSKKRQKDVSSDSDEEKENSVQSKEYRKKDADAVQKTKPINVKSSDPQQSNVENVPKPQKQNSDTRSDETSEKTNRETSSTTLQNNVTTHSNVATNKQPKSETSSSSNKTMTANKESHSKTSQKDSNTQNNREATTPRKTNSSDEKSSRPYAMTRSKRIHNNDPTDTNRATSPTPRKSEEPLPKITRSKTMNNEAEGPPKFKPFLNSLKLAKEIYTEPQFHKTIPPKS